MQVRSGKKRKKENPFCQPSRLCFRNCHPYCSTELLPQAKTKSCRSLIFWFLGEILSCLGSGGFGVNVAWVVSSQWLGVGFGGRAAHLFPSCVCRGHQGWSERLMVKGGAKHSFGAVTVGEVALPRSSCGHRWLSLGTMLSCRVQFHRASETGGI